MPEKPRGQFIWYELMTSDLDTATAFYGSVVGWDIRDSGMPGPTYLLFGKDGKDVGGIMSWKSMGMDRPTKWAGHLYAADVDAETAAVVADGGTQHRPPSDIPGVGRFSVLSDPQGAEILLFQPNPTEPPSRLTSREVGSVGWHELATTDWQKAWEFYAKHFGWAKNAAVDMGPMGTYQTFSLPGGTFGGGMMNLPPHGGDGPANTSPAWLFYFVVDDIKAAALRVQGGGGAVTHGPAQVPGGGWILQGIDTQGGRFALTAAR